MVRNNSVMFYDLLGMKPGTTCSQKSDIGNRKGNLSGYGFISATSPNSADIFNKASALIDSINTWSDLQGFLGLAGAAAKGGATNGIMGAGSEVAQEWATGEWLPKGYGDFVGAAGHGLLDGIKNIDDEIMRNRDIAGFRGARMDVFFEWQECECKSIWRWERYRWSKENRFTFHCHFNIDNSMFGASGNEGKSGWFGALDQKSLQQISLQDMGKCLSQAFEAFKSEILDQ